MQHFFWLTAPTFGKHFFEFPPKATADGIDLLNANGLPCGFDCRLEFRHG